jgi:outer membrane protein TolC
VYVAQNNLRVSSLQFEERVMDLVMAVNQAYWRLVFAIDDLKVKEKSLQSAQDLLKNNQIKFEAGALARIEVTRARSRVADREAEIVLAKASIKDSEDALRAILGHRKDQLMSQRSIVPIDPPIVSARQLELAESVAYALAMRPRIRRQVVMLESMDVLLVRAKNEILPRVDLQASYAINGFDNTLNDSWNSFTSLNNTDFATGLFITVPIGNRGPRSEYMNTRLQKHRELAELAVIERDIVVEVKKAIRDVATALQALEANTIRVEAAQEQVDAELQKFDVGQNISTDVLDAQGDLQEAESALIEAKVRFNVNMARYYRQTGKILRENNVTIIQGAKIERSGKPVYP